MLQSFKPPAKIWLGFIIVSRLAYYATWRWLDFANLSWLGCGIAPDSWLRLGLDLLSPRRVRGSRATASLFHVIGAASR